MRCAALREVLAFYGKTQNPVTLHRFTEEAAYRRNAGDLLYSSESFAIMLHIPTEICSVYTIGEPLRLTGEQKHHVKDCKKGRIIDVDLYGLPNESLPRLVRPCNINRPGIAAEDEFSKSLDASIARLKSSLLHMTPSQASRVDFTSTAHLETLFLAGQAAVKLDLAPHVRLVSGHSPLECTFVVTCASQSQLLLDEHSLGHRIGSNTWVVSNDGELCGIGEVGELWIEGPLVGLGYIDQERETASAFVNDPHFITSGAAGFQGRTRRFFKTGDLVWQQADGSLILVSRKDDQVKVHGHSVELGEIEHHIRDLLSPDEVKEKQIPVGARHLSKLTQQLPGYMIPSRFVPCATMARTSSGAVDRRKLREQAKNMSQAKAPSPHSDTKRDPSDPLSILETQLSQLWGEILGISNRATITAESNFFALGGDSMSASRLTMEAGKWGLAIALVDMAEHVKYAHGSSAIQETSHALNGTHPTSTMMNLFSLTPFQKRNLSGTLDQISKANNYLTFDIPSNNLINHFDILRTVFTQIQDKYYQTILASYEAPMKVEETSSTSSEQILETIIKEDLNHPLAFGQPWFQSYLIHEKHANTKKLVLRYLHPLIRPQRPLCRPSPSPNTKLEHLPLTKIPPSFFLNHILAISPPRRKNGVPLPLSLPISQPSLPQNLNLPPHPLLNPSGTPSARFTASVALALSRLAGQSDILFGRLTRNAEVLGGSENVVPVRVNTHTANSTPNTCIAGDVMGQMIEGMGENEEGFDLEGLVALSRDSSEVEVEKREMDVGLKGQEEEFGVVAAFYSGCEGVRQVENLAFGKRSVVFSAEVAGGKGSSWKVSVSASSDVQSQQSLNDILQELRSSLDQVVGSS
ncbi:uncharacterized protein MYCFIDRAFT_207212 [Pseudocercospora fijiensis CIRAD86]|uniref:Carrier domain-containing protein n=1 Tax=Pseudocercospora fijiensis (strain CIRAD86) TaxID=383855 RepID=M2ZZ95_PSEFD|nr:uncharacterized protein MYCFIDRAFT_207212 [Pseudocercospora fijiensis CIRAD86]EME84239.1 hypothetical protein MYCFIDRAFT_207212 [Pseudocercospora fijiensis CIRAD86]